MLQSKLQHSHKPLDKHIKIIKYNTIYICIVVYLASLLKITSQGNDLLKTQPKKYLLILNLYLLENKRTFK